MVHNARPPATSRNSFLSSGDSGARLEIAISGERKKSILESCRRLGCLGLEISERAETTHPAVRQKDEGITDAFGVSELVDS